VRRHSPSHRVCPFQNEHTFEAQPRSERQIEFSMKRKTEIKTALCLGAFTAVSTIQTPAQIVITEFITPYTQNFDTLSSTAGSTTNGSLPPGWALTETGGGARDNEQYAVDTGGSSTGDTFSYGSSGSSERALGTLRSGTLISTIGAQFVNNTGATISSMNLSYTGEQWRLGAINKTDRLDFQLSVNATSLTTGTWTDVDALDFSSQTTTTSGAKDGNNAANRAPVGSFINDFSIANGSTFWIRWTDVDALGADDGLAIDNLNLSAVPVPEPHEHALMAGVGLLGLITWRRCHARRLRRS
jgi:hypothetical protein